MVKIQDFNDDLAALAHEEHDFFYIPIQLEDLDEYDMKARNLSAIAFMIESTEDTAEQDAVAV